MALRHPNILQLYGTATYDNIHAAVFHDDLIPYQQFLDIYKHSHFSTVYIHACVNNEFQTLLRYFRTTFDDDFWDQRCTFYIRCSSGRFCADLVSGHVRRLRSHQFNTQQGLGFLARENSEGTIINSLTLDQYHALCRSELVVYRSMSIPPSWSVTLGSVFNYASDDTFQDGLVKIAWLLNTELSWDSRWYGSGDELSLAWVWFSTVDDKFWLSQANYVFTTLQISANFQITLLYIASPSSSRFLKETYLRVSYFFAHRNIFNQDHPR
ncbi:hypothetical protein C8R45DRAFT_322039 [Mycena sanguinolenta]|nr:hypothetical protein C8R45DRAFT_322039 [Mycena sanguinolenta]